MTRVFLLLLLVACASSHSSKVRKSLRYIDGSFSQQHEKSLKDLYKKLKLEDRKYLIAVYFDFYSFSLKNKCAGLSYKSFHPQNKRMGLPAFHLSEIVASDANDSDAVYGVTFDLTSDVEGQRYEYFRIDSDIAEYASSVNKVRKNDDLKIVLLRTGDTKSSKYIICSDQIGNPVTCLEDKLIPRLADINDYDKFCQTMQTRKSSISDELLVTEILSVMQKLTAK